MKNLPATIVTQIDAQQSKPVLIFTLNFSTILRFAASKSNVTFPTAGNTYVAKAVMMDALSQEVNGNLTRVRVHFDNTAKDMAAYAVTYEFQGIILNVNRIFRDALGDASYYDELFNGPVETYEMDYNWCTITARSGFPLSTRCPSRIYQRKCPWTFGGTECNRDGLADITAAPLKVTGTADSGTTLTLIDNALTQAVDFWNYGILTCTKAGVTESRIVSDFDATLDQVSVSIPFSFTINNATTYILTAGCDKIINTCRALSAYGPTASNNNNYGGFPFVGKRPISAAFGQSGDYQVPPITEWGYDQDRMRGAMNSENYYLSGGM